MNEPLEVVYLAGRLGLDDDGWPLVPLLDRLQRRGVRAHVVCLSQGSRAAGDPRILEFPALGNRWLRTLEIRRLRLETRFQRPQLAHLIHDEMAELALAVADSWRLPYVETVDDFDTLERGLKLSRRWFRGLIATSHDLATALVEGLGMPAERITVIPPGIALPPAAPRSTGWNVAVIGSAGPPVESSGLAGFLEAAQIVLGAGRDAEFLIASQGNDAFLLRRHAQSLQIAERVTIADFAVIGPRFWSVLDLYCQPSRVPSTGRTLALALAQGVPSIATDVRGLHTLMEHGRLGLLVPPDDPEALAAAMIELLDHPNQAASLSRQAQAATCARFDLDLEADRLAEFYRRQLDLPSATGGSPS